MRQMEFKMERPGLVEPGQIVDVTEGVVAAYFYYTIKPLVGFIRHTAPIAFSMRIFIIRLSRLWQ